MHRDMATLTRPSAGARPPRKGSLSLASSRSSSADTAADTDTDDPGLGLDHDGSSGAWWLSSDTEHAHTACPLRPFAHMVVGLAASDDNDACATAESISAHTLAAAHIVHLSDALRRKMYSVAPDTRADRCVGDMLSFAAPPAGRARAMSTGLGMGMGLWGVLGWLVGSATHGAHSPDHGHDHEHGHGREQSQDHDHTHNHSNSISINHARPRLYRRQPVAQRAEDDPLLVGNEGLGSVEIATVRASEHSAAAARGGCVFALCAHAMSPETQARWLAWHARKYAGRTRAADSAPAGLRLAVVHVAEVSTLHRVARLGVDALVPPPLPMLEQSFAQMADSGRVVGPPPAMPPLLAAPSWDPADAAVFASSAASSLPPGVRWLALLVSRHGLVEMAHPLARTPLVADDPTDSTDLSVALGAWLGESLFGRIHPEDVVRVVRALRLAWDARPDTYHFARLRRLWQQKRRTGSCDRIDQPATRQVLRHDGIEVANGVVELNVQLRLSGPPDLDWADTDTAAVHTRFARMKLTRWPLVLKPSRASAEPQDGFVLVGMQPLPEPSGARRPYPAPAHSSAHLDAKKRSISSVASATTLVGLSTAHASAHGPASATASTAGESADLVRLCRSASNLLCQDSTARPSVAAPGLLPGDGSAWPGSIAIPAPRAAFGLPGNAVLNAAAMPPHMASRRRSNIVVGSLSADADVSVNASADGLFYGTPRELPDLP